MVGFGGINPAGRLSFNHGYRRMVIDALGAAEQDRTYQSLAALMRLEDANGRAPETRAHIRDHTLIRRIELWDPDRVLWQGAAQLSGEAGAGPLTFVMSKRQLPERVPDSWQVEAIGEKAIFAYCADCLATAQQLNPDYVSVIQKGLIDKTFLDHQ